MYNVRNMNINNSFTMPTPINIYKTLTKLWEEYVLWMRSFIISTVHGLQDLQFVSERLLEIPADFARFLEAFYGENISREFERVFRDNLLISTKIISDIKKGDTYAVYSDRINWYRNADELASLLARITSIGSLQSWQNILYQHLSYLENATILRINENFEEDTKIFDNIEEQALQIADLMSQGIVFYITKMPF